VRIFAKVGGAVTAVAISPDGKVLAAAGGNVIKLWDIGSGKVIKSLKGHEASVYSLEFSKNGGLLASGSADDTVRLWFFLYNS
jgi:transcription initiation factor TFIID subunit 5